MGALLYSSSHSHTSYSQSDWLLETRRGGRFSTKPRFPLDRWKPTHLRAKQLRQHPRFGESGERRLRRRRTTKNRGQQPSMCPLVGRLLLASLLTIGGGHTWECVPSSAYVYVTPFTYLLVYYTCASYSFPKKQKIASKSNEINSGYWAKLDNFNFSYIS